MPETALVVEPTEVSSLYAKYLKERSSDNILETSNGFATFRYLDGGKSVYIIDIYVLPEHRKSGEAARIADNIVEQARVKGCTELLGSVCPSANGSTISLKVLLGYGMTLKSASNDFVIFTKEIK